MRRSACVILIDEASFNAVRSVNLETQCILLPNCVDIDSLPVATERTRTVGGVVVFLGWVLPSKGVSELVEAWGRLNQEGWELQIVGPVDPAYRSSLIASSGGSLIRFIGEEEHSRAMERMAACDLVVLPSYTEGFPNVVLEAMALGRAVIATRVGAIPEMLADGAGILIEPKDSDSLSSALRAAMADADVRRRVGRKARVRALEEYSLECVFSRLTDVWKHVGLGFI